MKKEETWVRTDHERERKWWGRRNRKEKVSLQSGTKQRDGESICVEGERERERESTDHLGDGGEK